MQRLAVVGLSALCALVGCSPGGGGGQASHGGCGDDNDCKGDRVCDDGMCVDPGGGGGGGGDGDGDTSGGDGDGDASGSGGSGDVIDDPALEAACTRDCEARHAAGCEMNIGSLDQCRGQCLVVDEIQGGYCLDERREQYDCLADGGYTCVNGYPQQQSTCIAETQALSTCTQEMPCRQFCDRFDGMACAPAGDCFESCRAEEMGFQDASCSFDYSRLVSCWGADPSCDGDQPSVSSCQREVADVADCIALRQDECEGFCWAAEAAGCGSDSCVTDCTPKLEDVACGYLYRRFIECTYDRSYDGFFLACVDGEPEPTSECDSERTEYEACVNPPQ